MRLLRDWNRFWFKPTSTAAVSLLRICMGLLVLAAALQLWPDRFVWFSEHGLMPLDIARSYNDVYTPGPRPIDFLQYARQDWEISAFFIAYMLVAISMTIGFCTRTSIFLVWVGLNCIHNRDSLNNTTGGDEIMIITVMYLFLARSNGYASVDRLIAVWRGKDRGAPEPPMTEFGRWLVWKVHDIVDAKPDMSIWPQRLMQIQVSIVYMSTFMNKTLGQMWQNGTAIYYPYQTLQFHRYAVPFMIGNFPPHFPFAFLNQNNEGMIAIMTYGTLAIEIALGTLVWVPRIRLYVLAAGVFLHLGIEYAMNIPLFAFLMISTYISFLSDGDLRRFGAYLTRTFRLGKLRVVFDGECDFCRSAVLLLRSLDSLRLLRFLDYHNPDQLAEARIVSVEDADQAVIAIASPAPARNRRRRTTWTEWPPVTGDERCFAGFHAVREIAKRVPALWPTVPILFFAAIGGLGDSAYRWVAANRMRLPVAPAVSSAKTRPRSSGRGKVGARR